MIVVDSATSAQFAKSAMATPSKVAPAADVEICTEQQRKEDDEKAHFQRLISSHPDWLADHSPQKKSKKTSQKKSPAPVSSKKRKQPDGQEIEMPKV